MTGPKILVLNPSGTDIYDEVTREVAIPAVASDTEVVIRNLEGHVPRTAFLPAPSVLLNALLTAVVEAEKDGFDAVVIACCDDPGLLDAKELVSIPVTGPMEAAVHTAAPLGRLAVIAPRIESGENENLPANSNWVRRRIHQYGMDHNFAGVRHAPCPHPSAPHLMQSSRKDERSGCQSRTRHPYVPSAAAPSPRTCRKACTT